MADFNELVSEYAGCADFLSVYVEEMHASDSWKYEGNIDIKHHRTLDERISAANLLQKKGLKSCLVADTMNNESCKAYAAMPERLYVVLNGKVMLQGGKGPHNYSVDEVREWLRNYSNALANQQ